MPQLALRGASGLAKKLELYQAEAKLSRELATIICNANDRHEGFANAVPSSLELGDLDFSSFEQFLGKYRFNDDDSNHLLSVADRFTNS